MRLELLAPTAEDTRAIGERLSELLRPGDAVALTGELGAGKTTFAQGVVRGLGYGGPVVSPTFTLVREYRAERVTVFHADVYRLDLVQEVLDLGLQEMLDDDGVLLIEWGDVVEALLPTDHLVAELTVPGISEERAIAIRGVGRAWDDRWGRLEAVLGPWRAAA